MYTIALIAQYIHSNYNLQVHGYGLVFRWQLKGLNAVETHNSIENLYILWMIEFHCWYVLVCTLILFLRCTKVFSFKIDLRYSTLYTTLVFCNVFCFSFSSVCFCSACKDFPQTWFFMPWDRLYLRTHPKSLLVISLTLI